MGKISHMTPRHEGAHMTPSPMPIEENDYKTAGIFCRKALPSFRRFTESFGESSRSA